MSVMAKSLKTYFLRLDNYDETQQIYTYIPISMRNESHRDKELQNEVSILPFNLRLPSSLDEDVF
jgi:hypothetical protein